MESTLLERSLERNPRSRSSKIEPGLTTQDNGKPHVHQVIEEFWQCIVLSQADEIELIYKGESVTFFCPDRKIVVSAVENHFGLKRVLFDKKCHPTDVEGLTYKRFGENVKSLTVTGEPAGVLSCPIHHGYILHLHTGIHHFIWEYDFWHLFLQVMADSHHASLNLKE